MNLEKELNVGKSLIKIAGAMLLERRKSIISVDWKKDDTPACNVDRESSKFLTTSLLYHFQIYGLLDEEGEEDLRKDKRYFWVVDPLDGTLEYLEGGNNFGLMIGLVKENEPVLGIVYRPLKNEIVYAVKGCGAFLETPEEKRKIKVLKSGKIDILISAKRKSQELESMLKKLNPNKVTDMSTSFKTIEVAKGNATLFLCNPKTTMNLWDLCAPQIILEEAGGKLSDLYGKPIDYKGNTVNKNGVVASNKIVHDRILEALK